MYFFTTQVFQKPEAIRRFVWMPYAFSLLLVVIYATVNHAANGFSEKSAHWAMSPFYNDHTAYAAVIALFLPVLLGASTDPEMNGRFWRKIIAALMFMFP